MIMMIMIIMCIIHGDISCHLDEVKEPWRDSIAQGTAGLDFWTSGVLMLITWTCVTQIYWGP